MSRKIQYKRGNHLNKRNFSANNKASVVLAENSNRLGSFQKSMQHSLHGSQKRSKRKLNSICRKNKKIKTTTFEQGLSAKICSSFLRGINTFLVPLNTRKHTLITL